MPIAALWPLPRPSGLSFGSTKLSGARGEADYLAALQALLPQGRAWPRDPATTFTALLDGVAKTYATADARAANLLIDAFPVTTVELLPEWEQTLGLPDPCLGPAPTIQQRQNQVVSRILGGGGQSIGYLTSVAASLGFPVGITEFAPFRVGVSDVGDALNGSMPATGGAYFSVGFASVGQPLITWNGGQPGFDWSFVLFVKATVEPTTFFRVGVSAMGEPLDSWFGSAALAQIDYFSVGENSAGDPLASWGAPILECELRRIIPAQTIMIFAYGA